jgi:hypothetical protein
MVPGRQISGYPTAIRGRTLANVHGHVENLTNETVYKLALRAWLFLEVQATQYSTSRGT